MLTRWLRIGAGQKTRPRRPATWLGGWGFEPGVSQTYQAPGRKTGWKLSFMWLMIQSIISSQGKPNRNCGHHGSGKLPSWWVHPYVGWVTCPDSTRRGHRSSQASPYMSPHLACSICILHNKTVICSQLVRSAGGLGSTHLVLGVWSKGLCP